MLSENGNETIDYLVLGHVTKDIKQEGFTLGGTVSFASLTAHSLGMRVGIVTSCTHDFSLSKLNSTKIHLIPSSKTTSFENIYQSTGRVQVIHDQASEISFDQIPEKWTHAPIVHLGPVACELPIEIIEKFPQSFIGITPQGWMRKWDAQGHVTRSRIHNEKLFAKASAMVLSIEDIAGDESWIDGFVRHIPVVVVTEGAAGARLYWNGDMRYFRPPAENEVDPTGAGDIFAAAFFYRLQTTFDPWESTRFATLLAAGSVTRSGLEAIPTKTEIKRAKSEILTRIDQL